MKKLLIATRNKDKIPEITNVLGGLGFEIVGVSDILEIPKDFDVVEDGKTFEENAIKKAVEYGKKANLITLSDDSGICVDALGGRPGTYSARWVPGSAEDRNKKLLEELKDVPKAKRTAQYVCVIAIYDPELDKVQTCEGSCEGIITMEPMGKNGFGYDPIFFSTDLNKAMGQASMEEKNSVSHRGRALRKVREILQS